MAPDFVHLHVHSHFSLLDGCTPPEGIPKTARALGQRAIALTDHGVLHGVVPFVRSAEALGVKPLLGCELYVAPRSRFERTPRTAGEGRGYHLTLLAESDRGFENLSLLSSRGFLEGYGDRPRVDKELLAAHSEGLIVLSGCLEAEIPTLLRRGEYEAARRAAGWFAEVFGEGRFFLELMDHGLEEEKRVNEGLIQLHRETGLPLVATNDAHYASASDAKVHELLLCVQAGKRLTDRDRPRLPSDQYYLKSAAEMERLFGSVEGALDNTVAIAERCSVTVDFSGRHLPRYDGAADSLALLRSEVLAGARRRYGSPLPERAAQRIAHELEVIEATGFADYFLIVWDLVRFAKERGIAVGPGRGSSASSVVAYALGITDVDPLAYGLLFERFLNPERVTMPDIDIDFCYERRWEVLEYAIERYGRERVAQIGTFGTFAARAALRDVGRLLGLPDATVDRVAKRVPPGPGATLAEAAASPSLRREMEEREEVKRLVETALRIEGTPRHLSVHAAGIVIGPWPLEAKAPLCRTPEGTTVTQYPGEDLEALGFLKMDLLGLRTLTVLSKAVALIHRNRGIELDLARLPLDDARVYAALSRGEAEGVFQLETGMFQSLLREVKPREFSDLVAILALGRPGPMARLDDYLRRRRGEVEAAYPLPAMEKILEETHGIMLYQEQVMQVAVEVAGYSAGQADLLRRAMGKKRPEIMAEERERFVEAAASRGVDAQVASGLFDEMARFAEYGFAKSHSVAYALLAYQTAYLKVHYPQEYLAAQMSSVMGTSGRVSRYLGECRRCGIPVFGPDVNASGAEFSVEDGAIRFGLAAVKNVGRALAEAICEEREKGAYRSLEEFCDRLGGPLLTRKALESLARVGAFDELGVGRAEALARIEALAPGGPSPRRPGQEALFFGEELEERATASELSLAERLSGEFELLGAYLSAHPLDPYREVFAPLTFGRIRERGEGEVAGVVVALRESAAKGGTMAFAQIEDGEGRLGEAVIFPRAYERGGPLAHGRVVVLRGRLEAEDEAGPKLLVDSYAVVGEPMEVEVRSEDALRALHASLRKGWGTRPVVLVVVGERSVARLALPPRYWAPEGEREAGSAAREREEGR